MLPSEEFSKRFDEYKKAPSPVEERLITWELMRSMLEAIEDISANLSDLRDLSQLRNIEGALATIAKDIALKSNR